RLSAATSTSEQPAATATAEFATTTSADLSGFSVFADLLAFSPGAAFFRFPGAAAFARRLPAVRSVGACFFGRAALPARTRSFRVGDEYVSGATAAPAGRHQQSGFKGG